ncbi:hypothetical protein BIY24_10430 [Halobacteriovorax marinus]|uniref:4'-phosphopantetheinyl transferase superfamily protein n=1 Tax=Halobacteriovorax marinus TaxID=97084 RepID=UPI000BC2CCB0|nr:4'-phosphopantetheinyl transferase superfamily protein [Halobacteriovorax marinus]ATH08348.1 hypothetical protein BIY24_10430 [Halobacteriovorax marinus]
MTLSQQEISLLFDTLSIKLEDTYQGEIPRDVSEVYPSKKRVRDHYTSRLALLHALESLKGPESFQNYSDLIIDNHHHLRKAPEILVSLTHTIQLAAAVVSNHPKISSLGIDLESTQREMKEGILKFFIRDADTESDPLKNWCIKEAAFKALSPLYNLEKRLVLKDIIISKDKTFFLETLPELKGHYSIEERKGHYLALAITLA